MGTRTCNLCPWKMGGTREQFILVEQEDKLYRRVSMIEERPVVGRMDALEDYQKTGQEIPVNLQFCLAGMEESGSEGQDGIIFANEDKFFKDVDYECILDNYWLGKKPCTMYSLRGICYFFIKVECSDKDLYSVVYGGSVHEAMTELISLRGFLIDQEGNPHPWYQQCCGACGR